ncbi:DUF6777 domain-containing protein [Streptomyces sp. GC420]|uniref:DUF6777 domain-containing protein n=1 Tax=Streptomyces sp. GC420 TaxID=2697568 RepID=UPI0014151DA2|nr:DUF6777 domain-containing protein [Streptomyces sp. GC420]NBM18046.1 hypothetical protein [Streptomyces sp. GC420]
MSDIPAFRPVLAGAVLLALCTLTGCGDAGGARATAQSGQEILLLSRTTPGPDPFTASTARVTGSPAPEPPTPAPTATSGQGIRSYSGAAPGLYGGTLGVASCDVERQVRLLTRNPRTARAFARGARITRAGIPGFLRGLTPVVLRADTRVTNHRLDGGVPVGYQAVLQAGTAVLVDAYGMPRVRCACGNPLEPPADAGGEVTYRGSRWEGFRPGDAVVVLPAPRPLTVLVIVGTADSAWIERRTGDDGGEDRTVPEPDGDGSPEPSGPTATATGEPTDGSTDGGSGEPTGGPSDGPTDESTGGSSEEPGEEPGEGSGEEPGDGLTDEPTGAAETKIISPDDSGTGDFPGSVDRPVPAGHH